MIGIMILLIIIWSIAGAGILGVLVDQCDWLANIESLDFLNPLYIRKHCRVNLFGLCLLTFLLNMTCPPISIVYWIYKLSTIGT